MATFDLDLQGHLYRKWSKFARNGLVHSITLERKHVESPNLVYRCTWGSSRIGLHMATFYLDLQVHLYRKRSKFARNGLVHSITLERKHRESPNLVYRCIWARSRMGLHMVIFVFVFVVSGVIMCWEGCRIPLQIIVILPLLSDYRNAIPPPVLSLGLFG